MTSPSTVTLFPPDLMIVMGCLGFVGAVALGLLSSRKERAEAVCTYALGLLACAGVFGLVVWLLQYDAFFVAVLASVVVVGCIGFVASAAGLVGGLLRD